jgi:hypothetical protein
VDLSPGAVKIRQKLLSFGFSGYDDESADLKGAARRLALSERSERSETKLQLSY